MEQEIQYGEAGERGDGTPIQMPAVTLWPLLLALGVMLVFAGIAIQTALVSYAGLLIGLISAVGWWRVVIPEDVHELCPIEANKRPSAIEVGARSVMRLQAGRR